jgi:hypothetical protein
VSHPNFKDDAEVAELVRGFEACEIHPAEFKHYQHLTVALWYVAHLPYDEAREKMKTRIKRLAASYGKTGYHETITEFWLRKVRKFLDGIENSDSISARTNQLIETYADKNLIFDYYSKEVLDSQQARTGWIEPDLKPLHP